MKLLIVEDNAQMRKMIKRMVSEFATPGEIIECEDGAEAVVSYALLRPDWVLMDIELPNVNGIEATRRIISEFPAAKVLMVTNYGDPQLRSAAEEAGASGYLLKDNLMDIKRILSGQM